MGYSSAGFSAFLNAMTELRNQRLRESLAEAQMQQESMQQLGKGIGSLFQGLGGMAQQGRQDSIANRLMNTERPPSAMAVDPAMQAQFTGDAGAAATGGMDEMKMRMQMENMRQQQMRSQAYRDQVDQTKARALIKDAQSTWQQSDKKLQGEYTNEKAYIKEMRVLDAALGKAEDPMSYQSAVDAKVALNKAGIKRGMDVQPIDPSSIPPFMTPDQKAAIAAQREAVQQAQSGLKSAQDAPMGAWDSIRSALGFNQDSSIMGIPMTFDKERAVKEAQAKFDQEQKSLSEMPGGGTKAPIAQEPPISKGATGATGSSQFSVGQKQYNAATGQTREWDGEKWIYVK